MRPVSITGIGSYLPRAMLTNDALPPLAAPATPEELAKIGVVRRGWAGDGEGVAEMAAAASRVALERAGMDPTDLDGIVLSNWTQRRYIPEFAPKLKELLGARRAFAFDVSTACAGFVHGAAILHGFLQNPRFSRALVVASETTSQRGRPGSRATLVYGDGAGAFALEADAGRGSLLLDYELAVDGSQHHIMDIGPEGWVQTHVKQQELIALTARCFKEVTRSILARNGLTMDGVNWLVPHSGTAGVQAALLKALEIPREKVLTNFASIGNTSSAAIPLALDELVREGRVKKGDLVLSPAVGTGFYSAALLYRI
jgi:3-oxoacyl-[acyl-carrier-protein] synthase-3